MNHHLNSTGDETTKYSKEHKNFLKIAMSYTMSAAIKGNNNNNVTFCHIR